MPKVLVVDDHAFIRRGVRSILEPFPEWELCGEAENGQEAIRKAGELQPAVVVMDVSMPVLDGIAATETIKRSYPQTHIVLLTLITRRKCFVEVFKPERAALSSSPMPTANCSKPCAW
jgi:DNA-binding NarL/FixJ family response regulator